MNQFLLTQQEAKELIEPYAHQFYQAIQQGFNDFTSAQAHRPVRENATKSHIVWDYILQRVNAVVVSNSNNLRLQKKNRMFYVEVNSKVAIKFKKFDDNCKSSNIQTGQVLTFRNHLFEHHGQQIFPIEIGWNVDEYYSNITSVNFVSPFGEGILWRIEYRPADKTYTELFTPQEIDIIQEVTLKEGAEHAKKAS